jgi:hypothetical protein
MGNLRIAGLAGVAVSAIGVVGTPARASDPIQISFLWHMHQPRYIPGQSILQAGAFYSFNLIDVHNTRFGPYTTWPRNAVSLGLAEPYLGAQVSFSGSLAQNLDELEAAGTNGGMWNNWDGAYDQSQSLLTVGGHRRLELVAFAHHHALLPLLDERDIRMQIRLHKFHHQQTFGSSYSRGMFPPETAFSTRIIPALVAEGVEWVMVDNIHFDRACVGYPYTPASNLYPPNRADQVNPDPATAGGRWVQLQNLWAPSRVSVPFGYQPHVAQHVNPASGQATRMVVVPAARYEGNEDGRGGYGAFLYDRVMDAYLPDNNAADRPMLVLLHHDGDNFGGGSDAYYGSNFQNMVNWVRNDADYEVTTVNDYLARFPVPQDALIHVEDGSWAGADNGDPEFIKWLGGDVNAGGQSPDINSWAVLTAAKNWVFELDDRLGGALNGNASMANVLAGTGSRLEKSWFWLLTAQASDYWYWDGTEVWDSNVTRGSNGAVGEALAGLNATGGLVNDGTPPMVFVPQREPYNPGSIEWGTTPQPSDFEVWTLAYDRSGLTGVTLKWRVDADGVNPLASTQNETYAGGAEVGAWQSAAMTGSAVPTPAGVLAPTHKAMRYGARITGQQSVLIDYYVEAADSKGNLTRSPIRHVWVGNGTTGGGGNSSVSLSPNPPVAGQNVTISYEPAGGPLGSATSILLHHGFNGWSSVVSPDPAMSDADGDGVWTVSVPVPASATELNVVFNNGAGVWDNNAGQDWAFTVDGGSGGPGFVIDGTLDAGATLIDSRAGVSLWAGLDGDLLYLAATPAGGGNDRFIVLAGTPGAMGPAMWAKAGQVAGWDAFVGNEESNGWHGWFDAQGATQLARGSVLEATIDLAGELTGSVPESVWLAVLSYASADGGALAASVQVPGGNGNGNVEAAELLEVPLCSLRAGGCCPADLTGDGEVDSGDLSAFVTAFLAQSAAADLTGDGQVDSGDLAAFVGLFLAGCSG